MNKFLQKYNGILRAFKGAYIINNWKNVKLLARNKNLYKKFGLKKSIFAPIDARDFKELKSGDTPWLDRQNGNDRLKNNKTFIGLDKAIQEELLKWNEQGYATLRRFFPDNDVDAVNTEIEHLKKLSKIDFNYSGSKLMQVHRQSPIVAQLFKDEKLLDLLSLILGKAVIPFQTINFLKGSEQKAHSDHMHMSTYPNGYVVAAWIALEDVDEDNGALFFYPGSHKLPYLNKQKVPGHTSSLFFNDFKINEKYETYLASIIEQHQLQSKIFKAQKGDVLIWHHNLIHGGLPMKDSSRSRKSMVSHYFAKEVIAYHEISSRPALINLE